MMLCSKMSKNTSLTIIILIVELQCVLYYIQYIGIQLQHSISWLSTICYAFVFAYPTGTPASLKPPLFFSMDF